MLKAYRTYWKKYAEFEGESTRSDFWWVFLIKFIIGFALFIVFWITVFWQSIDFMATFDGNIDYLTDAEETQLGLQVIAGLLPLIIFMCIWGLVNFIPSYALQVRRLRDAGLHWSFVLLNGSALLIFITAAVPALFVASLFITLGCKVTLLILMGQASASRRDRSVSSPYTEPLVQSYDNQDAKGAPAVVQSSAYTAPVPTQYQAPSGQPQPQGYHQVVEESVPPLSPLGAQDNDAQPVNNQVRPENGHVPVAPPSSTEGGLEPVGERDLDQQTSFFQSPDSKIQETAGLDPVTVAPSSPLGENQTAGEDSSADSAAL